MRFFLKPFYIDAVGNAVNFLLRLFPDIPGNSRQLLGRNDQRLRRTQSECAEPVSFPVELGLLVLIEAVFVMDERRQAFDTGEEGPRHHPVH